LIRVWRNSVDIDEFLGHWFWAVPILLAVAILAIQELERYSPSPEEFGSMINVGWVVNGPYSPQDVLESLQRNSPNQAPLYFLLLNLWGNLVPPVIAMGRVLSLYCGLLTLAVVFRLARDFVAPIGGLMALLLFASNAFQNIHLTYMRNYQLFLLASGSALWVYLRILYRRHDPKPLDYIGFFLACLALAATHAISIFLFLGVGAFHLLAAPKGASWLRASLCVILALLLYSPWTIHMITDGYALTLAHHGSYAAETSSQFLTSWFEAMSNRSIILLILPLAGLVVAWRRQNFKLRGYHFLFFYFLAVIVVANQAFELFGQGHVFYMLPSFLLLTLAQTAGLYALYRMRRWLFLLTLLWILAGVAYQSAVNWKSIAPHRARNLEQIPFHTISRYARATGAEARIITYRIHSVTLRMGYFDGARPVDHYFGGERLDYVDVKSLPGLDNAIQLEAVTAPSVWLIYQDSLIDAAEAGAMDNSLATRHYTLCDTVEFANDTILLKYQWSALYCGGGQALVSASAALIDYQFLGARVVGGGAALAFSDEWLSVTNALPSQIKMSYQLLNEAWEKVAQLDLPLVHEGVPRQFTIDTRQAPTGAYRLMAILYDGETRERFAWADGADSAPHMLWLADIEL